MHKAVAHTTHTGVPTIISGNAASCALPAYTTIVISTANGIDNPPLTIATPVTRPQAAMPRLTPLISRAPARNCAWRSVSRIECMGGIVPVARERHRARAGDGACCSGIVRLRRLGRLGRLLVGRGVGGGVGCRLDRRLGRGPGFSGPRLALDGRQLGCHRLDLVFAHVVVHVAPTGEHRSLFGLLVEQVAVFDGAAGMAAGAANRLAFGFT